jgi:hypothetical protein
MAEQNVIEAVQATHLAYCALVVALQNNGVLPISAVVTELGNQIDADMKQDPAQKRNQQAQVYYETLVQLQAYFELQAQAQQPQAQP